MWGVVYLDVLVGGADALLDGAEGVGVAHLAELAGHAGGDAAQDGRRLLSSRFYHRFSFLVSVDRYIRKIINIFRN